MRRKWWRALVVVASVGGAGGAACALVPDLDDLGGKPPEELAPDGAPPVNASPEASSPAPLDGTVPDGAPIGVGCGCRDVEHCVICDDFEREGGAGDWDGLHIQAGCGARIVEDTDRNRFMRFSVEGDAGCVAFLRQGLPAEGPSTSLDVRFRLRVASYGESGGFVPFRVIPAGDDAQAVYLRSNASSTRLTRFKDYNERSIALIAAGKWVQVAFRYERNADAGVGLANVEFEGASASIDTNASRGFDLRAPLELNVGISYVDPPVYPWVLDADDVTVEWNAPAAP